MNKTKAPVALMASIIFAGVLIAAALFYTGYNYSSAVKTTDLDAKIEAGIENYFEEQQAAAAQANQPKKVADISVDDDAVLGDPDAPVTIIEFSDYECPYCKRGYDVVQQIKEKYIDTGKVKFVYRDFPLSFHQNAKNAAMAAECAGDQDKYYEMHDQIFENQKKITETDLKVYAEDIGLNMTTFNDCFDNETHADEIQADFEAGREYGVTGTPAFFVNGWYLKGAQPFSEFEKLIEQELE